MGAFLANGYGRLIPILILLVEGGVVGLSDAWFGGDYLSHHGWPLALGLFVCAVACWLGGQAIRRREPPPVVDEKTGREPSPGTAGYARYITREMDKADAMDVPRHSLFFMPVWWWGPILATGGVLVLAAEGFGWIH